MIRQYNKLRKNLRSYRSKIKKTLGEVFPFYAKVVFFRKKWWAFRYSAFGGVDEKRIVFRSNDGNEYGGMPKRIYEQMLADPKYDDYKFVWIFRSKGNYKFLNDGGRTRIFSGGSKKGIRIFEKSHYIVTDYELAPYERIRKNQVLVFDPEEYYGALLYLGEETKSMVNPEEQCGRVLARADFVFASTAENKKHIRKLCQNSGNRNVKILGESQYLYNFLEADADEKKYMNFTLPEGCERVLISLSGKFVMSSSFLRKIERENQGKRVFLLRNRPLVTWDESFGNYRLVRNTEAEEEEEDLSLIKRQIQKANEGHEEEMFAFENAVSLALCPTQIPRAELFRLSDVIVTDKWNEVLEAGLIGKQVICVNGNALTEDGMDKEALQKLREQFPEIVFFDETTLYDAIEKKRYSLENEICSAIYPAVQRGEPETISDAFIDPRLGSADGAVKAALRKNAALFETLRKLNQAWYGVKAQKKAAVTGLKEFIKKADVKLLYVYYTITGYFRSRGINFSENAKELYSYKNKYKGQRCFLIGNGPSLTTSDLELLQNEITFGCNRVYKLFPSTTWRPTYFCMIDALIAKYSSDELAENVKCPLFTNINTRDLMKYRPEHLIFARNLGENPYRVSGNFEAYYVPSGATVMTFMIELAMYMGFQEIYLIGVDCTSSLAAGGHCAKGYVNQELIQKDIERIRKRLNDPTLTAEQVAAYYFDQSTYSYKVLRDYADRHGIHIYNATRGGMLEVYERRNLDEVVSRKHVG